jgi:outer membrane protein OmpA-like peptidoglycan-associated protein
MQAPMQAPRRAPKPAPVAAPPAPPPIASIKPAAGPGPAAKAETPALAPPAIRKRAPKPAPQEAAIPPVPAPPKAPPARAAAPSPDVPPPPPPPVPRVEAAPRTPVLSGEVGKEAPKSSAKPAAETEVAAIPRGGAIASGATRQITFAPGSAILEPEGKATIGAIALALAKNPALRVELKAYARGTPENVSQARRLSLSRALAIRSELMRQGVKPTRIDVRALGNRVPGGSPSRADLLVFTR